MTKETDAREQRVTKPPSGERKLFQLDDPPWRGQRIRRRSPAELLSAPGSLGEGQVAEGEDLSLAGRLRADEMG